MPIWESRLVHLKIPSAILSAMGILRQSSQVMPIRATGAPDVV